MADLQRFREKVREYRSLVGRTQTHLANYLSLDYTELSNRLNATKKAKLSHENVRTIVRALAEWGAIATQAQALELLALMDVPSFDVVDWQAPPLARLKAAAPLIAAPPPQPELVAAGSNSSNFMQARLKNFVGREQEQQEIRRLVTGVLPNGGYLTISGQAGQGKSSLIARLVEAYSQEWGDSTQVVHHFIPFNPGPNHQVSLLRDLLSQLVRKYQLADFYLKSESSPALRDYLAQLLTDVTHLKKADRPELIFIDGLDQLEDEPASGGRDLSFLPVNVPAGVVFVLGTRPNDTLKPLRLLKPQLEYPLPDLSRTDFDLLLARYGVQPGKVVADHFYEAMQHNALYLSLVAQELANQDALAVSATTETIARIADNPDYLFSLTFQRLKKSRDEWREVLWPVLGFLLAAHEPLNLLHLRQLTGLPDHALRDGLERLGGLLAKDENGRFYLYHLKLRDYLRQSEARPGKDYLFAREEEIGWHARFAQWCKINLEADTKSGSFGGRSLVPKSSTSATQQQVLLDYARQYYARHLYLAEDWASLWEVLDEGSYGLVKLSQAYSIYNYAQDLELGRETVAAILTNPDFSRNDSGLVNEQIVRLWRYSLLRCKLSDWANNFLAAEVLTNPAQTLALADLLTRPEEKVLWLEQLIARYNSLPEATPNRANLLQKALLKAYEALEQVVLERERQEWLSRLLQQTPSEEAIFWQRAERVAENIADFYYRALAYQQLAVNLERSGRSEAASRLQLSADQLLAGLQPATLETLEQQRLQQLAASATFNNSPSSVKPPGFASWLVAAGILKPELAGELQTTLAENSDLSSALGGLAESLAGVGQLELAGQIVYSLKDTLAQLAGLTQLLNLSLKTGASNQKLPENLLAEVTGQVRNLLPSATKNNLLTKLALATFRLYPELPEKTIELVRQLSDPQAQVAAFIQAGGFWNEALALARGVKNVGLQGYLIQQIAVGLAQSGKAEQAYQLLADLKAESLLYIKITSLCEIALLATSRNFGLACLNDAEELVKQISPENQRQRTLTLRALATAWAQLGNHEAALAHARKIPHSAEKANVFIRLAIELARQGSTAAAFQLAQTIVDTYKRALAIGGIIAVNLVARNESFVEKELPTLLKEAGQLIRRTPASPEKTQAQALLAYNLTLAGDWAGALKLVDDLEETVQVRHELLLFLLNSGQPEQPGPVLEIICRYWCKAATTEELLQLLALSRKLIRREPSLGWQLYQSFQWVDNFLAKLA